MPDCSLSLLHVMFQLESIASAAETLAPTANALETSVDKLEEDDSCVPLRPSKPELEFASAPICAIRSTPLMRTAVAVIVTFDAPAFRARFSSLSWKMN